MTSVELLIVFWIEIVNPLPFDSSETLTSALDKAKLFSDLDDSGFEMLFPSS